MIENNTITPIMSTNTMNTDKYQSCCYRTWPIDAKTNENNTANHRSFKLGAFKNELQLDCIIEHHTSKQR